MKIVRQTSPSTESSIMPRQWEPLRAMRDILRWDPFRDLFRADIFRETPGLTMEYLPSFDVRETPREIIFTADVPGIKEQDIEISVTGNRLTISGKREEEERTETDTYYAMERSSGSFCRGFTLPPGADLDGVQASLNSGVLTVTVPKKSEAQARRVSIQSGGGQSSQASSTGQMSSDQTGSESGSQTQVGSQSAHGAQAGSQAQGGSAPGYGGQSTSQSQVGSQSGHGAQASGRARA